MQRAERLGIDLETSPTLTGMLYVHELAETLLVGAPMGAFWSSKGHHTANHMDTLEGHAFSHINVGLVKGSHIGHIELNRPDKSNAFDAVLWEEFPRVGEEWLGRRHQGDCMLKATLCRPWRRWMYLRRPSAPKR